MSTRGTHRTRGSRALASAPGSGSEADRPPPEADPESGARAIVLRRLTLAPRTRAQLADDLRRKGVPDDVAQRVLDRFADVGLVDDDAFARAWVRSRHQGRGLARRALAQELRQRGVDPATVAVAVEDVAPEDEAAAAAALVAKRLPASRGLPRETRIRRLSSMLARKGYSGELSARVVRAALAAEADAAP